MIQIIGAKRIVILILLVAVNAALAAAVYLYVIPEGDRLDRELRSTRGQISTKRAEANRLRNEFQQIQEQKSYFENLQAAGFMSDQNRLVARRRIISVQQYTKVLKAGYDIDAAEVVQNELANEVGYAVLNSPIDIQIDAMDDIDFYNFIYWMENGFPGHMAVNRFHLKRVLDLNEATLRSVGGGSRTALMKGDVSFSWRTMVPQEQVQKAEDLGTEGF